MDDVQNLSESVQNDAETFGNIPNQNQKERTEHHTLTVRQAARVFEDASVARTERSVTNWCHKNKHGIGRLDCYYDPNEKKYFITPQSVNRAIEEEQAKANPSTFPNVSEDNRSDLRNVSERESSFPNGSEIRVANVGENDGKIKAVEAELMDARITNKAKDLYIERLTTEREKFISQLLESSREIGQLETQLRQLEAPKEERITEEHGGGFSNELAEEAARAVPVNES